MTTEDQVVALFAKANPVPSLDLLDPIEPVDLGHLEDRSERSREVTELKTIEPIGERSRRPRWLVPALAAAAIALVAIPTLENTQIFGEARTPAEEVATAFMEALDSYDGQAALELFTPDGTHLDEDPIVIVGYSNFDRAVGFDRTSQGCSELTPVSFPDGSIAMAVECEFILQTDVGRALGLEPTAGTFRIYVEEGRILRTGEEFENEAVLVEATDRFSDWVRGNHPDDYALLFEGPGTDPEAIALLEQYTDEFVAEIDG